MNWRIYLILHLMVAVLGTAGLWWFVFRRAPEVAVADGSTAAALASYIEVLVMRRSG